MKLLTKFAVLTLMVSGLAGLSLGSPAVAVAQEADQAEVVYRYVAQTGDSYSQLARKAVQTFGLEFKVNLSLAQIIAAETNLTQAANSPSLDVGQEVTISQSVVREWVEAAQKLSPEQQALWQPYSEGVDFNTDSVGEAS